MYRRTRRKPCSARRRIGRIVITGIQACLLLIFAAPPVVADSVKLSISPSASNLFAPARLSVTCNLTGGSDADPALLCLAEEWSYSVVFENVTNREVNRSMRESPCASQTQPAAIAREFTNSFLFMRPGRYMVRLELRNRDGKVVASNQVSVRVLRPANPEYQ
ncbi:MAG: hypothetical protein HYX75_09150 [Acidobacteria bacterium]|nr:hypothetical protein [Acidobacteriota bacterium]